MAKESEELKILERKNIYFLFQPRIEQDEAKGLGDVQRFYLVLSPRGQNKCRRIVVGKKRLRETGAGDKKNWGFVNIVASDPTDVVRELEESVYGTKNRGERHEPPARPAGEGGYSLVRHSDHTHLLYALELPKELGLPQKELHIEEEGSYIISVKNPEAPSLDRVWLADDQRAAFPGNLQQLFHGRKFLPVNPPNFLDHEGAELLLIGAAEDISAELGFDLNPGEENEQTAEIFRDLRLKKSEHPTEPLFQGKWR